MIFFFYLNYWNHWQQSVKWSKEWEKVCVCVSFEHSHWWVQSVGYHPHSITHRPDSRVVYSSLPERTKFCSVLSWGFFFLGFCKTQSTGRHTHSERTKTKLSYSEIRTRPQCDPWGVGALCPFMSISFHFIILISLFILTSLCSCLSFSH